jgi:hypothetical protein
MPAGIKGGGSGLTHLVFFGRHRRHSQNKEDQKDE